MRLLQPSKPKTNGPKTTLRDDVFLLDRDNRAYLEGHSQTLGSSTFISCLYLFMVPFVVAGVFMLAYTLYMIYETGMLNFQGVQTEAAVIEQHIDRDNDGTTYWVTYRYYANGVEHTRKQNVSYDLYNQLAHNSQATVIYIRSSPYIARLRGTISYSEPLMLGAFSIVWNGFVGLFLGGFVWSRGRDNKLAREGQLVMGEVFNCRSHRDSDDDLWLDIEYAFHAPDDGRLLFGSESAMRNDYRDQRLPPRGATLAVLYLDEKHHKAL